MIAIAITLLLQLSFIHGQSSCTPAAIAACGTNPCVQTGTAFSCLCPDMTLQQTAAACGTTATTAAPVVIPNQCANAVCPAGASCIPTNQNPAAYVCICPNNVLANPDCPTNLPANNPCAVSNPCSSGGTCVINPLSGTAVCVCPNGTYGPKCGYGCRPKCDSDWCYNGGRCTNAYGQAYCACGKNFRGRRCELQNNKHNYVYLHHNPHH
ncbi:unnamed protein product [Adineta steineri]|uniref:EGF-like domain-containing protein n=1 Tax=Adineta steineri TaxID=433720 RepID=A0A815ILF2_9BILA|nr:unnamed protein product [Adineta steineri]CAF1083325.1 unnamed protein product [Adineta steineri]CAF1365240.1 unnamed protein product [Adineta steineri]CAF1424727.1 unnamed protein product [Adineta steineri]CAF1425330.1 unnamed protein product [Adineta steineri]